MTAVHISRQEIFPIQTSKHARNGKAVDAMLQRGLLDAANHGGGVLVKEIATMSVPIPQIGTGVASRGRWFSAYHSSPFVRYIAARLVVSQRNDASELFDDPQIVVAASLVSDGSIIATSTVRPGHVFIDGADVPSRFSVWNIILADSVGSPQAVPRDTDLAVSVSEVEGARLVSACFYEIALEGDTLNGYADSAGANALAPILDADREIATTILRDQWKAGAAHLVNYCVEDTLVPITTTSASWTNLLDNSSTTVSAATPGYTLDLVNKERLSEPGVVPCRAWVFAKVSAGGGGRVELLNSAAAPFFSAVISSTTASWIVVDFYFDALDAKVDLGFRATAGTLSVYAVSIGQYAT